MGKASSHTRYHPFMPQYRIGDTATGIKPDMTAVMVIGVHVRCSPCKTPTQSPRKDWKGRWAYCHDEPGLGTRPGTLAAHLHYQKHDICLCEASFRSDLDKSQGERLHHGYGSLCWHGSERQQAALEQNNPGFIVSLVLSPC